MPRRPTRTRRETRLTQAMTITDLHALIALDRSEVCAVYGSLEDARRRLDFLIESGQWSRRPGELPDSVWWFTEPDVPDELRGMNDPHERFDDDAWDDLEVDRYRFLAETGRLSADDLAAIALRAELSPYHQFQRIVEAVS